MNILAFFNRDKNDSANIAKRRLQVAVGKTSIDIDNIISDLQEAIHHSLAKYDIHGDDVFFKQSKNKLKVEIAVES